MKKLLLLLLLPFSLFGQTTYQLNYDSIRVNKTTGTGGTSLYGKVYLKNVGLGLQSDSILTVKNGRIRKVPVTKTGGGGGGSSVSYYLNGSVNQGTFVGNVYREINKTPIIGAGTDFTIATNGYITQFITDANDPNSLLIPAGNWNFETYFSASSGGGSPSFYVELYKYNGTTFTLIASNSATPELISFGTAIQPYFSSLAVPETVLLATDRLAVRIYVTHSGKTITLHTENGHLSQIVTTFTTGLQALNGLTKQTQYFAVGTSGTDFGISSSVDTHTFNLPSASAANRGVVTTGNQTFAGEKTFNNNLIAASTAWFSTIGLRKITAGSDVPFSNSAGTVEFNFGNGGNFTANSLIAQPLSGIAIQANTTTSNAIQVTSTSGNGVDANSTTGSAINGNATGTLGYGISGQGSGSGGGGGYFTGSLNAGYAVYASATGTTTTALYGTGNSGSFPVQSLVQLGAGNIATFANSGGQVASITNAGGLTATTSVDITTGSSNIKLGSASNYGYMTLNGSTSLTGMLGLFGGASGDNTSLYLQSPSAGNLYYRVAGLDLLRVTPSGDLIIAGSNATKATGTAWINPSDSRLKTNIRPYNKGLAEVLKIEPKVWNYNVASGQNTVKNNVSVIAQELQQVMPEMVLPYKGKLNGVETELLSVDASDYTMLLINAVKEQNLIIKSLEARIKILEDKP